ncbi:MAG: hypothetical protein J5I47_13425 [Vicingus serpentipes]|nr:hypothetical protein [Vicingus serpentipes]
MLELTINKSTVKAAECWNDLKKDQLLKIVALFFNKELKMNTSTVRYALLYHTLNIKWYNLRFLWIFIQLPKVEIVGSLFPLIKWIEKENTLTEFKIKTIRSGFKKLYAPANGLTNITINEFRFTDELYIKYKKTADVDYLNTLVGILYRPKRENHNPDAVNYQGDIREDFNEHHLIRNANRLEKISLSKKQVIYLAYEGSRNKIIANHPHLFNNEEAQKQGKSFGYGGLILEMSGVKFGSFKETCQTNLITAFNFLEMQAIKAEKQTQQ